MQQAQFCYYLVSLVGTKGIFDPVTKKNVNTLCHLQNLKAKCLRFSSI